MLGNQKKSLKLKRLFQKVFCNSFFSFLKKFKLILFPKVPFLNQIKRLFASDFYKFSAVLLSSNAIAQIIVFVAYPFITRLYSPEIFGVFNLFLVIVGILKLLTTGQYELAIVLPESDKKASALFHLSLLLTVGISLFFFIFIILFGGSITVFFHQEQLASFLPYLPIYLLLSGFWQTMNYYFVRHKKYYNLGVYSITQSVIGSATKCLLGFKGFLFFGLLWGQLLGQLLATLTSIMLGKSTFKHLKQWDKKEIAVVAETYSNFPKYQLPHALLNMFAANLPVLLLSFYFDMEKIGLFSMALTIGLTPVTLFSNSICQVMFRKMSELVQNKEKIKHICFNFCKMCLIFILPFFILFMFVPDSFFTVLFGEKWTGVGFYFKCMLPCLFLSTLVGSLSFIPDIFFKQKAAAQIEFIYTALKAIALLTGVYLKNFDLAIIFYCIIIVIMLIVKLAWYFGIIKKYEFSKEIKL